MRSYGERWKAFVDPVPFEDWDFVPGKLSSFFFFLSESECLRLKECHSNFLLIPFTSKQMKFGCIFCRFCRIEVTWKTFVW